MTQYRYAYTYDSAGNRTQMVRYDGSTTAVSNYAYNAGNQLTEMEGPMAWFTYDLNGNMIRRLPLSGDTTHYLHNRENRMVEVARTDGSGTTVSSVGYAYDAMGRLLLRTAPDGSMVRYYYDAINTLLERGRYWSDFYGEWQWRTVRAHTLAQAAIGQIAGERTMTAWHYKTGAPTAWSDRWYHYDMLGNVTGELDAAGLVQSHVWMEAFGTVLSGGQTGRRLTTKTYDMDAGLYYFSARWYEPRVGVFCNMSPYAPLVEPGYSISLHNPVVLVDPTGDLPVQDHVHAVRACYRCVNNIFAHKKHVEQQLMNYPERASSLKKCFDEELADCMKVCGWAGHAVQDLVEKLVVIANKSAGAGLGRQSGLTSPCCRNMAPATGPEPWPRVPPMSPIRDPIRDGGLP